MGSKRYSVEQCRSIQSQLQTLGLPALDELFRSGSVPAFDDIEGRTSGAWLAKPAKDYWWAKWFIRVFLANPLARWTGKAFLTPFDRHRRGRGANLFRNRLRPVRYRLATFVKRAEVDEKDCLTLEYPIGSIMYGLIDDVRQIDEGVLLGQMHYRFPWQKGRTFIGYFVLCTLRNETDADGRIGNESGA